MAVIDERGKVFGLVNIIDAGVAAMVVAVLALMAIGFQVFKVPATPEIARAEPASQPASASMRLIVHGKNLLPFMRVSIQRTGDSAKAVKAVQINPNAPADRYALVTTTEARFFVESPTVGEVWLPLTVEPGTYDLVLFNEARQIGLKEAAFTITPPLVPPAPPAPPAPPPLPLATVRIYGTFTRVERPAAAGVTAGMRFTSSSPGESAEVVSRSAAEPDLVSGPLPAVFADTVRVPAIVRARCSFNGSECRFGTTPLSVGGMLTFKAKNREYKFYPAEFAPDSAPLATVRVSGAFSRLDQAASASIVPGAKLTSPVSGEFAEVLSVGSVEPDVTRIAPGDSTPAAMVDGKVQVPANLRLRCSFSGIDCRVYTTKLARNASVTLTMGGRPYTFVVAEFAPDGAERAHEARVAVRLVVRPEMAALIKQGDVDTRQVAGVDALGTASARIAAMGARRESTSATQIPAGELTQQTFNVQEPVVLTDVTLSVPVTESSGTWFYKGQAVRAGAALSFETSRYTVRGYILSVGIDDPSPAPKR